MLANHKPLFIAVEGPIGAGKTSLATLISETYSLYLLKEIVSENPFLSKFYENIDEYSFQTEMFFLCNRVKQLEDLQSHYLSQNQSVVSDYHIMKNLIFARLTLTDQKYQKYQKYAQIYDILSIDLPKPNVLIYLNVGLDTLLKRISVRGRDFEKNIDPLYLERLSSDYEEIIDQFKRANPDIPVITLNGDDLDFVNNKADREYVMSKIEQIILNEAVK